METNAVPHMICAKRSNRGQSAVWSCMFIPLISASGCTTPNCISENVNTALEKSYHITASNDIISIILVVAFEYKYLHKIKRLRCVKFMNGDEKSRGIFKVSLGSFVYQERANDS
jgi:hypothetical protein